MNKNEMIKKAIKLITSALIALAGIALVICCTHIYSTGGERPFSREVVGKYLVYILPILLIALCSVIANIVVHFLIPDEEKKLKGTISEFVTYKRIKGTIEKRGVSASAAEQIKSEIFKRRIIVIAYIFVCVILTVIGLIISTDSGRYTIDNINGDIALVAITVLSMGIAALGIGYICDMLVRSGIDKECKIIKSQLAEAVGGDEEERINPYEKRYIFKQLFAFISKPVVLTVSKCLILALAIVFIILGIFNGGMADVLGKAVKICTECIGLG